MNLQDSASTVESEPADGFGIYVHWPFCAARCPYCDFNAYADSSFDPQEWTRAYVRQIDHDSAETADRLCSSIFFGGGTPSLMHPETVAAVIECVDRHWGLSVNAEITLEANPSSSEAQRFSDFRSAGVNRLSIGVQSLRDRDLAALGRLHTAKEARLAFEAAAQSFGRVSIDLMYGRQDQTLADWQAELEEALGWGSEHLSLYQLTVEPGTPFGARHSAGRLPGLADDELAADMHLAAVDCCSLFGARQYEVSNFSRRGCECRHNLLYWRGQDYLGIGPGAHGRLTVGRRRAATETHRSPAKWLQMVAQTGTGESKRGWLTGAEQANEYLMMSLRLAEGSDMQRFQELAGMPLNAGKLAILETDGLVRLSDGNLSVTRRGGLLLNSIVFALSE